MSSEAMGMAQARNQPAKRRVRLGDMVACCALLAGLLLSGWSIGGGHRFRTSSPPVYQPMESASPPEPQVIVFATGKQADHRTHSVRRIETIGVGDRVLGRNPLRQQVEHAAEPESATWRLLRLEMRKSNGRLLYVELLRPLSWLGQDKIRGGAQLRLDLPEMGAQGWANVTAIDPCPIIQPGPGQVVTGRFQHEPDDNILDVRVSGQAEPIGVTDTHPWWSEDRRAFVPVGQLRVGEKVRTSSLGVVAIASIQHRPREAWVYNLEVQGEHVYQVSDAGVLVHNQNQGKEGGSGGKEFERGPGGARKHTPGHRPEHINKQAKQQDSSKRAKRKQTLEDKMEELRSKWNNMTDEQRKLLKGVRGVDPDATRPVDLK